MTVLTLDVQNEANAPLHVVVYAADTQNRTVLLTPADGILVGGQHNRTLELEVPASVDTGAGNAAGWTAALYTGAVSTRFSSLIASKQFPFSTTHESVTRNAVAPGWDVSYWLVYTLLLLLLLFFVALFSWYIDNMRPKHKRWWTSKSRVATTKW
jgi:hypothetical protein